MASKVIGVDFSGVICSQNAVDGVYHQIPCAFEILTKLREKFGQIFIISHADLDLESKILWWLWERNFYDITGIEFEYFRFCRERIHKASICKKFGITDFIDDRTEVLGHLYDIGIPNLYLFQGRQDEIEPRRHILPSVKRVESWQEVTKEFFVNNPSI